MTIVTPHIPHSYDLTHINVSTLRGVGKQTLARLQKVGLRTLLDLILHLPARYQDRTHVVPIAELIPGQFAVIEGEIISVRRALGKKPSWHCQIADHTGKVMAIFFHLHSGLAQQLTKGALIRCYADVAQDKQQQGCILLHPTCDIAQDQLPELDKKLTPIYPLTEGIGQTRLQGLIQQAITILSTNTSLDLLPDFVRTQYQWPEFMVAIKTLHQPDVNDDVQAILNGQHPAQQRLIVEELLAYQLCLRQYRLRIRQANSYPLTSDFTVIKNFIDTLPFELTNPQQKAIDAICTDMASSTPMLRLLQGDVGSGKTIVAATALLHTAISGYQAALMAPTELLAEQLYQQCHAWFSPLNIDVVYLSGKLTQVERCDTLNKISDGQASIVVGTHALFQQNVTFAKLAFICIDEQHRFGVKQRLALYQKGKTDVVKPHQLVMSATPIPRTLALLQYADLDCSILNEMPPSRLPIKTVVLPNTRRHDVIQRAQQLCEQRQQVYWVCPLIDESENLQCETVDAIAVELQTQLPQQRIGIVHGRINSDDKSVVMQAFQQGEIDILVATTVIEVGVNVPNATLIVIENAERMGIAQLHQLRGRIGRGAQQSFCILLYQPPLSEHAKCRLQMLRDSQDGFYLAEQDLQLRGSGELLGTRQTGMMAWRIASLPRDQQWLDVAAELADQLLQEESNVVVRLQQRW